MVTVGRLRYVRRAAWLMVAAILATMLAVLPVTPAAADGPEITLAKDGPGGVLAGENATYTLRATNPAQTGAVPEFNLSFSDVLPVGATYVSGSTTPSSFPHRRSARIPAPADRCWCGPACPTWQSARRWKSATRSIWASPARSSATHWSMTPTRP